MRTLRVHTNAARFEAAALPDLAVEAVPLARDESFASAWRDWGAVRPGDVVVVSTDVPRLVRWCLVSLLRPKRFALVSLDIVLPRPRSLSQRLSAAVKKWLLRRVDHFIVFQHDLAGYDRHYGVSPSRSTVIPFKVNLWERQARAPLAVGDDGHLLFVGRTYRDVPTFLEAVRRSGVPAAMVRHSQGMAAAHGTDVTRGERPPNLHEIVDDGGHEEWLQRIANSRGIVLPIQEDVICCAGISTLYDAMALGKPVVISDCPATRGVVTADDVALVPAGDVEALAAALHRVSTDEDYRARLVARGHEIAARVQGEVRLYRDVLAIVAPLAEGKRPGHPVSEAATPPLPTAAAVG